VFLGLVAAFLQTFARLRLGIPGHAALVWLVPVLVARCVARTSGAASISTTSTALGLYAFGGFTLRWPLVVSFGTYWLVGPVLDLYVLLIGGLAARGEGRGARLAWLFVPLAGVVGNYAHLALKLLFGAMGRHAPGLGLPSGLYEAATYLVFGLAAGVVAYGLSATALACKRRWS